MIQPPLTAVIRDHFTLPFLLARGHPVQPTELRISFPSAVAAFETVPLHLLGTPRTCCCELLRKAGTKADSPAPPLASTFGAHE